MNWPGFYAWPAAWLALLAVPLVALYFLKLRRPVQRIPSLVLWQQVLADQRVNSPLQKFKRNLLLLVQLLLLLLLVLAAMQPFLRSEAGRMHRVAILIDTSASMAALDQPGGRSRLEVAQDRARSMIEGMLPDQAFALVTFDAAAQKQASFTDNKRLLLDALEDVAVRDLPSDLEGAMRLATALARATPIDEVVVLSDGNFPTELSFDVPFAVRYEQLEPAGVNAGITALSARRAGPGRWDVLVALETSSPTVATGNLSLHQDGELIASEPVTITGRSVSRLVFGVAAEQATELVVRLVPDGFDSLAADDTAYLSLERARPLSVYVPPEMGTYRAALRAMPEVVLWPGAELGAGPGAEGPEAPAAEGATPSAFDLVITDAAEDMGRLAPVMMTVGLVPEALSALVTLEPGEPAAVIDWRRLAPLLEHVELADLAILGDVVAGAEVTEADYENLGYEVLVYGRRGPLLLRRREGAQLNFHLLFHTDRSTLPYRVGFPVLLANLVRTARSKAGLSERAAQTTGVLAPITVAPARTFEIHAPGGVARRVTSDAAGQVTGTPAPQAGIYELRAGGGAQGAGGTVRVGASLLHSGETVLAAAESIHFGELSVAATAETLEMDRSIWPALAAIALGVLLLEWWLYQRRGG